MAKIGILFSRKAASNLKAMIDAHAADAGRRLGNTLRPWLRDGETLPDFALALQLPARMIEARARQLVERRDELDGAKNDEEDARLARDHAASALRRKLVEIRRMMIVPLGPQRAAAALGIKGKTAHPSQHALLLSQAEAALKVLGDPGKLKIPPTAAGAFDPVTVVGELEPMVAALRASLVRFDEVRRQRAFRREMKDNALNDLGTAVRALVLLFRGCFLLIGRKDLAAKIREVLPS